MAGKTCVGREFKMQLEGQAGTASYRQTEEFVLHWLAKGRALE